MRRIREIHSNVDVSTPVLACPCHFQRVRFAAGWSGHRWAGTGPPLQLKVAVRDDKVFVTR